MAQSDIGIYGLGVIGRNLALNLAENGFGVSVYNRSAGGEEDVVRNFMDEHGSRKELEGFTSERRFVDSLSKPAVILMSITSGAPVDKAIESLTPLLSEGDILIDGGNSHFRDTGRRCRNLFGEGIHFVGMGISGGAEGARSGPSLMPGGSVDAWSVIKPVLTTVAARTADGRPACSWIGVEGTGHFVKMVHNGIEYADMQLLAEAYHLMKTGLQLSTDEIAEIFRGWNNGMLESYLTDITADIFEMNDEDGSPVIDKILDRAGQKGTGRWTAAAALDLESSAPLVTEAVVSRFISSYKPLRKKHSDIYPCQKVLPEKEGDKKRFIDQLEEALTASRIMALSEGFMLIDAANREYDWTIEKKTAAGIWSGGSIIRSQLMESCGRIFDNNPGLEHLMQAKEFRELLSTCQPGWRKTVSRAVERGIPAPGISSALSSFDSLRTARLPANLIQAQRDYFGSHGFERVDEPRGTLFHLSRNNEPPEYE